ncbi:MAG TPA: hypothetical protein VK929_09610 [Longimicrobiales bacterium]|nr:hypothetical protein [Longimicrobiales bacterium]
MGLFSQLRERRIVQIVMAYMAGAWVALEVIDQFVDREIMPDQVYLVALILAAVGGLPAALIIGWYHGEKGRQSAPRAEIAMLVGVAVIALGLSSFTVVNRAAGPDALDGTLDVRRVAVLYLDPSDLGADDAWLADAFTEDLIAELSQVRGLDVVSRNGAMDVRDLGLTSDSIARRLDAGTLVDGHVERRGDRIRVALRLVDGASGVDIQRISFESPADDVLTARDQFVEESARLLRGFLGEEIAVRQRGAGTSVRDAWSHAQQAERLRKEGVARAHTDLRAGDELFARADALLARAEVLDSAWAEPAALRGEISHSRVRAYLDHPHEAAAEAREGIEHANRALQRNRNHARALEVRGTLQYILHLLHAEPLPAEHAALRDRARADLQRAVQLDASLASAHSTLSHLYMTENPTQSLVSAQRAFEEDAFLESAPNVLWRLFLGSMEIGGFAQAQRWCAEGNRRFTDDYRFASCELYLMTTPSVAPDPARAWQLAARTDSLAPGHERDYQRIASELAVGSVLARAQLSDSARAVVVRARNRIDPALDPTAELTWMAGYAYVLMKDHDEAVRVLRQAVAMSHGFRATGEINWRWRELQAHPEFQQLVTAH